MTGNSSIWYKRPKLALESVRAAATTDEGQQQLAFADDPEWEVRAGLAGNIHATEAVQLKLVLGMDNHVRDVLAKNPSITEKVQLLIAACGLTESNYQTLINLAENVNITDRVIRTFWEDAASWPRDDVIVFDEEAVEHCMRILMNGPNAQRASELFNSHADQRIMNFIEAHHGDD